MNQQESPVPDPDLVADSGPAIASEAGAAEEPWPLKPETEDDAAWQRRFYAHLYPWLFEYTCHIAPDRRFLYMDAPKTGCSTVKLRFARHFQSVVPTDLSDQQLQEWVNVRQNLPMLQPHQVGIREFRTLLDDPAVIKFSFIRNPYTRLLSAYLDKMRLRRPLYAQPATLRALKMTEDELAALPPADYVVSFERFLQMVAEDQGPYGDPHWRCLVRQICLQEIPYAYLGRFECFEEDYAAICALTDMPPASPQDSIHVHRTNAAAQLQSYYTPACQQLVRTLALDDFYLLGYSPRLEDALNPPRFRYPRPATRD